MPHSHDSGRSPGRRRAERPTGAQRPVSGTTGHGSARTGGRRRADTAATSTPPSTPASTPASTHTSTHTSTVRTPGRSRRGARASRRWLPSPAIAGATALVIAGVGAVLVSSGATGPAPATAAGGDLQTLSVRLPGNSDAAPDAAPEAGDVGVPEGRSAPVVDVSRDIDRDTLQQQAELQATQRLRALAELADAAQARANELRSEQWVLPLAGYQITATFGESSYLWSTVHTGLDFAAGEGTPLVAVAKGTITETAYDGAYGNKTVLTLEDGTDIWYCHQSSQTVSVGDVVAPGETIGAVGSTGNTTGPHLHLEVHPDGGDAVDPYSVLVEHGVTP